MWRTGAQLQTACISVFDPDGTFQRCFGDNGILDRPKGITVHGGQVIVASGHCITSFTLNGDLVRRVGSSDAGSGLCQFAQPCDVRCTDNAVYVADGGNRRVHVIPRQSLL